MLGRSIVDQIKDTLQSGSWLYRLIWINVLSFAFFGLFHVFTFLLQQTGPWVWLNDRLQLPAYLPTLLFRPYTLITSLFYHYDAFHLLFNMLALYWFGEVYFLYMGDKHILRLYLMGGLVGGALYILSYNLFPVFAPYLQGARLTGASAGILAIMFAAATINPEHQIRLLILGNVPIKFVAAGILLLDLINIPFSNPGGYIAHVGGALTGYLFMQQLRGNLFSSGFTWSNLFRPKLKVTHRASGTQRPSKSNEDRLNEILEKINKSSYDSLNKEEKEFLNRYSSGSK